MNAQLSAHHSHGGHRSSLAHLNPSHQAICNLLAQVNILREGIIIGASLYNIPHIVGIARDRSGIGVVRVSYFHGRAKFFVIEQLTNMRDVVVGVDGLVVVYCDVHVREEVSVSGAAFVVAGKDGFEGHDTVGIGGLDAATRLSSAQSQVAWSR